MRIGTRLMCALCVALLSIQSLPGLAGAPPKLDAQRELAIELGPPFRDHAILQRDMNVPVWGWSKPGTKVTVSFSGQKKTATANEEGKWMVHLDPLKASFDPAEMVISEEGGKTVTLKDILVGEVWMASGQSNMQWIAGKCDVGRELQAGIAERVEAGKEKQPVIREAQITNRFASHQPLEHADGTWSLDEANFSAIAYAFAYDIWKEVQVPIGILNCSFSQTAIQAWIPREGFAGGTDDYTQNKYREVLESDPTTPEHKKAWGAFYDEIEAVLKANAVAIKKGLTPQEIPGKTPGNTQGNRDSTWLFNARLNPMIPYAIRGAIWNQGYANSGEGLPYYHNLHSLIRGWREVWKRPDLPVYFHQFYSPGIKPGTPNYPSIGSTTEMRLGTLMARDIPNAGMASQIDITGAIHYSSKSIPGQRLARHALKNQYGKTDLVVEGPIFKSYEVKGDQVIISLEHAEGGLLVAETGRKDSPLSAPVVMENGEKDVTLFYVAGADRVWHPAKVKIDGEKLIVSSDAVKTPMGVTYGTDGVGFQPNIYNKAMLPMSPFMYYDNKMVTSETWPDDLLKIAGVELDPSEAGLLNEWRKMPILSTQFRDNAVLQAGQPITFFGSALHDWGHEAEGEGVIHFSFNGIEKSINVKKDMDHIFNVMDRGFWKEWRVTVPAMKASAEPKTLKVSFTIDGELAHERVVTNLVVGDVWYVAAPDARLAVSPVDTKGKDFRKIERKAKRSANNSASRYSIAVSRTPAEDNRFASIWLPADKGLPAALASRIEKKTGNVVGIIFMDNLKDRSSEKFPDLKSWMPLEALQKSDSLLPDYKDLAKKVPGTEYYNAGVKEYVAAWKKYWGEYIPAMMKTKASPDDASWGSYPAMGRDVTSEACETYNVLVHSFHPLACKGILFITHPDMVEADQGAAFAEHMTILGNSWKELFDSKGDTLFAYTYPGKDAAPKLQPAKGIKGKHGAFELNFNEADPKKKGSEISDSVDLILDTIVNQVYR